MAKTQTDLTPVGSFYLPHARVYHPVEGDTDTKQEFKDDCDINKILARFQKTGAINHMHRYEPQYGDFSAIDYQTAQNVVTRARQMFADLPSSIRQEFSTPERFLEFVQDPKNLPRMRELGLAKPAEPAPEAPPPPPPAEQPA